MSTNSILFTQNEQGKYDGISIKFDGYIQEGVGELLFKNWNNSAENHKLCSLKRAIRCFGYTFDEIDFYPEGQEYDYIVSLKNLTYDEMVNRCGNFDYAYYWDDAVNNCRGGWLVYNSEKTEFEMLNKFFNLY